MRPQVVIQLVFLRIDFLSCGSRGHIGLKSDITKYASNPVKDASFCFAMGFDMKRLLFGATFILASSLSMAQTLLYDNSNLPGITVSTSSAATSNNRMMGGAVFLGSSAGQYSLSEITFSPVFRIVQNYTNVQVQFSLWGGPGVGLTSGVATDAAFANRLATITADLGPLNVTTANSIFDVPIDISSLGIVTPTDFLGVQVTYLTSTAAAPTLTSTTNVSNAIMLGDTATNTFVAPAVGENIFANPGGWFRSASGNFDPNTSFTLGDSRVFQSAPGVAIAGDQSLAMQVRGTLVPEPASMIAVGVGAAALLRRRKQAKS